MALPQSPLAMEGAEVSRCAFLKPIVKARPGTGRGLRGRSVICFGESLKQNKFVHILSKHQLKWISQSLFFLWEKPLN